MERWQWCQAIEAAGGLQPASWLWLTEARSEYPHDCALVLEASCGPPEQLARQFAGRPLRLLSQPLTPRQRCLAFPCEVPEHNWVLLVGPASGPNRWEDRPLYGQRIALTREPSQAVRLQQRLQELGAEVILCPVLHFVEPDDPGPLQSALARLESYDWLLFTSPNGVRTFFEALAAHGDARRLGGAKIGVIGPGTASALEARGLRPDLIPVRSVAEGLLEALAEHPMEGQRVLIPRAQEAREILPEELRSRGAQVDVVPGYKTVMPEPPPQVAEIDRVILMSSSAARHFRQLCPTDPECICIGPITAQTARELGFTRILQARQFDEEGVVQALLTGTAEPESN
jgi:uroporphyrinogen III methyltransferase/synthase